MNHNVRIGSLSRILSQSSVNVRTPPATSLKTPAILTGSHGRLQLSSFGESCRPIRALHFFRRPITGQLRDDSLNFICTNCTASYRPGVVLQQALLSRNFRNQPTFTGKPLSCDFFNCEIPILQMQCWLWHLSICC